MAKLKGIKNFKSPDSIILSNFKKFGITTVFSIDNAFIEVAKLLGFRTRLLPAEDIVERKLTARQMRQIDAFFKQYKFKPFRRK